MLPETSPLSEVRLTFSLSLCSTCGSTLHAFKVVWGGAVNHSWSWKVPSKARKRAQKALGVTVLAHRENSDSHTKDKMLINNYYYEKNMQMLALMGAPSPRALADLAKRSVRSSCRYRGVCASHRPQMCFPWMRKGRKCSSSFAFPLPLSSSTLMWRCFRRSEILAVTQEDLAEQKEESERMRESKRERETGFKVDPKGMVAPFFYTCIRHIDEPSSMSTLFSCSLCVFVCVYVLDQVFWPRALPLKSNTTVL